MCLEIISARPVTPRIKTDMTGLSKIVWCPSCDAKAHVRAIMTLKSWGLRADVTTFLRGIAKAKVLLVPTTHVFLDDQPGNLRESANEIPCVHVPYGLANEIDGAQRISPVLLIEVPQVAGLG